MLRAEDSPLVLKNHVLNAATSKNRWTRFSYLTRIHPTPILKTLEMRSLLPLLSLSSLLTPAQSLYFFIDGGSPKCFFEELPKDTLVVGHFKAEEYDNDLKMWKNHDRLNIYISVDVRSLLFPSSTQPQISGNGLTASRKYSTTTTASSRKKAPQKGGSHSAPQTQATTRSASSQYPPQAEQAGSQPHNHRGESSSLWIWRLERQARLRVVIRARSMILCTKLRI